MLKPGWGRSGQTAGRSLPHERPARPSPGPPASDSDLAPTPTAATGWLDRELAGCRFADQRLGQRVRKRIEPLGGGLGQALPLACQAWAHTKAAYRFLANPRVNEAAMRGGHCASTRERFAALDGPVLVLHDTTELSDTRQKKSAVGVLHKYPKARGGPVTLCGILLHSRLAVTPEGLPLGLTVIKFWTRKKCQGTKALKRHVNPPRVPIAQKESIRWRENLQPSTALLGAPERCLHVGDRASDIYELFCAAQEAGPQFVLRRCVDRPPRRGARRSRRGCGRCRSRPSIALRSWSGTTR